MWSFHNVLRVSLVPLRIVRLPVHVVSGCFVLGRNFRNHITFRILPRWRSAALPDDSVSQEKKNIN